MISQELTFEPGCTFLARSSFHGPNTSNEVEIEPIGPYCPSNWPSGGESGCGGTLGPLNFSSVT